MYIVYSIQNETYELKLHKYTETQEEATRLLEQTALDFLTYEEGKRRAKILEGTSIDHDKIEKGYFLHRPNVEVDKIDVYYKNQRLQQGWVSSSVQYTVKKVMFFGISDFVMTIPENAIPLIQPVKYTVPKNTAMDSVIEELRKKFDENKDKE